MSKPFNIKDYKHFLEEITEVIRIKQLDAFRKVNKILIDIYWHIVFFRISKI